MRRLPFYSFAASLVLHLSLLVTVVLQNPVGEGDSNEKQAEAKGNNSSNDARAIAPKQIEVSVASPVYPKKGDLDLDEPEPIKDLTDCDGPNWYGGIGVTQSVSGTFMQVAPNYPADRAGILPGDADMGVTDEEGNPSDIRGDVGTTVVIKVYRNSTQQMLLFKIVRGKICLK